MSDETERAKEIDEAVKLADARRRRADAEAEVHNGEKLDNILKCLDSLGKRMDAFEKKPVEEDDSDDERTAKSYPPSSMNPLNSGEDPDAARPLGADSIRKDSAADTEEIMHFKAANGATRAIAADLSWPIFKAMRTVPRRHGARAPCILGTASRS